jgi:hypothetical protein
MSAIFELIVLEVTMKPDWCLQKLLWMIACEVRRRERCGREAHLSGETMIANPSCPKLL